MIVVCAPLVVVSAARLSIEGGGGVAIAYTTRTTYLINDFRSFLYYTKNIWYLSQKGFNKM